MPGKIIYGAAEGAKPKSATFTDEGADLVCNLSTDWLANPKLGNFFSGIIQFIRNYAKENDIPVIIVPGMYPNEVANAKYRKRM